MGMFDTIIVKRKLPLTKEIKKAFPTTDWSTEGFQTKDLDNTLTIFTIKGSGLYYDQVEGDYVRVISEAEEKKKKKQGKWCWPFEFKETSRKTVKHNFHGTVNFYHYIDDAKGNTWDIEFDATFNKGKLEEIELVKGEISSTAEENEAREQKWIDIQTAYENHPWTKTKKILNKITFGYWSKFWGNKVSRSLYWLQQKVSKLQLWVIRTLA